MARQKLSNKEKLQRKYEQLAALDDRLKKLEDTRKKYMADINKLEKSTNEEWNNEFFKAIKKAGVDMS